MTYVKWRKNGAKSTKLVSARIQLHHIEWAAAQEFVFGKLVNKALEVLTHDLQVDWNIKNEKYWLTCSGGSFVGYKEDGRGSVPKMVRVRADICEYMMMNKYRLNTAINLGLDRFRANVESGQVADWTITVLQKGYKKGAAGSTSADGESTARAKKK